MVLKPPIVFASHINIFNAASSDAKWRKLGEKADYNIRRFLIR